MTTYDEWRRIQMDTYLVPEEDIEPEAAWSAAMQAAQQIVKQVWEADLDAEETLVTILAELDNHT